MNSNDPERKRTNRAFIASLGLLVILYLSTPYVTQLSPNGMLDSFGSAVLALALSHVVLLVLPGTAATLLAALLLLSAIVYNVANGFFFDLQQTYLSINTLYLATEIMSLLRSLPLWQLMLAICILTVGYVVLVSLARFARPIRIRSRLFSILALCSLSVIMAVSYAGITDEAQTRVYDTSPLGLIVRSSGYVPFVSLDIELAAKEERDILIRQLKSNSELALPPKFSASSIGSLLGYGEGYDLLIENKRFPLFKIASSTRDLETPKLTKATNVLIVVMESMRASEMGMYGAELSTTPFMDQLAQSSVVASKFYATANLTVKSEHAINCSALDFMIGPPFSRSGLPVRTQCLPARLHEEGYRTLWFHGNTKAFYNRTEYLPKLGFQEVYSRDELDPDKTMPELGWGLTDETLFDEALDRLETVDGPFYAEILTVSNHIPFDFDWGIEFPEYLQKNKEDIDRYRRGIYYSDQALKKFHERFQNSSLAKNTILVVTGDHGIWIFPSEKLSGLEKNEQYFRVPLIIQTPEGHRFEVKENASHLDIAPTLSRLLGLKGPGDWMGQSLFEQDKSLGNRVTYLMSEQALSYRFPDRACIPSVQCENSGSCYRSEKQAVPESLCFRMEPTQDLLLDTQVVPIVVDRGTMTMDRALFEYSQIAAELGTSPKFSGE